MFRLRTFGGVTLERDGTPLTGRHAQRRRLALLSFLASARDRPCSRDRLVGLLWPESTDARARHTLAQTLYAVRQTLGADAFLGTSDDIRLNPGVIVSDVGEFLDALAAGDPERAVALHSGPFLDGFFLDDAPEFERWLEVERDRFTGLCAQALEQLARAASAAGQRATAAMWWQRRAALDPFNGRVAQDVMRALAAAGDRATAIRHARVHATLVREQLELDPEPGVLELAAALEADLRASPDAVMRPLQAVPPPSAASEMADAEAAAPATRGRRARNWVSVAATSAAILVVAVSILVLRQNSAALPGSRVVLLGAIEGRDTVLTQALREAIRAELEAAPGVRLLGVAPISEALRLMTLPAHSALNEPIALDVAHRRGVPFVLIGSVSRIGGGTQIIVRLLDTRTGAVAATLSRRAASDGEVLPELARLARDLRARLKGVPLTDSLPALPPVTTASLTALRNYVLARNALARVDRPAALHHGLAALEHDSLFALAHYLVGDVLWYLDHQRESERHLSAANRLSDRLSARERLIVRARYQQLVRDEPDSALALWQQLRASYPDEPQAYEGLVWAHMALGQYGELIDEDLTLSRDPASAPLKRYQIGPLVSTGDTIRALAVARTFPPDLVDENEYHVRTMAAQGRRDWTGWLRLAEVRIAGGEDRTWAAIGRHIPLLALGRLAEAAVEAEIIAREGPVQFAPRALLAQARAELERGGSAAAANQYAWRAQRWLEHADISPPAVGRIAERIADIAGRTRDPRLLRAVQHLVLTRDEGRALRSYRIALLAIDACDAYARGDYLTAAELASESRREMYFGRSLAIVAMLEADARAAAGQDDAARALYRAVLQGEARLSDGDGETLAVLQPIAEQKLARLEPVR